MPALSGGWGYWSRVPLEPGVIREPFTGAWQRNMACSETSLLAFSGVFACVAIIAGDVAKLPVHVYRVNQRTGEREEAEQHWAYRLFRKPNPYQTRFDLIQQFMASLLLTGNAYLWFTKDQRNVYNGMHVLDPRRVRYAYAPDSQDFFYIYRDRAGAEVRVDQNELLHHRVFTLAHPLEGVSPLAAAGQSAQTGLQISANQQSFFGNMSRPSGILTTPADIDEEKGKGLIAQWAEAYGPNAGIGKPALLTADLKWQPLSMNAEDAQLIEQMRWTISDVARCYRVPPFMLGDMEKASFRNSEQLMRNYYSGCLQSQIEALENRFETFFAFDPDMQIEFDVAELLRTDLDVRYQAYKEAITSGFMAINEVRAREQLPRIPGGDEPFIQMQYRPLSQAVREPAPAVPETPAGAAPAADAEPQPSADEMADAERIAADIVARAMGLP